MNTCTKSVDQCSFGIFVGILFPIGIIVGMSDTFMGIKKPHRKRPIFYFLTPAKRSLGTPLVYYSGHVPFVDFIFTFFRVL